MAESQGLLTKTVSRTNELIDGLPPMTETAAQMADLWAIAYPQLSGLLTKAGKWADKVAVPAGSLLNVQVSQVHTGGTDTG